MEFGDLVKQVSEKCAGIKNLEVSVTAKRDDKGEWALTFEADSVYMAKTTAKSPEGLLMKLQADTIPPVKLEDVGAIA